ncbi:MAG: hypothetical protein WCD57_00365 [Acidobacteriaceae bacterium]
MKALYPLAAFVMLAVGATAARADGGAMLLHQDAGAFTITLFAAPQPLRTGDADFSVMVQDRTSGEILLDPIIDLTVAPESPSASPETVRLAKGQASNRLLQACTVHFSTAGRWHLALRIRRGNDQAQLQTACTVEPNRSRATLVWIYVLLPVAIILLFIIHQALKIRSEG